MKGAKEMKTIIEGMNVTKFGEICGQLGADWAKFIGCTNDEATGLIDIELGDTVIIKAYPDGTIFFDRGGQLDSIEVNDYFSITLS